MQIDYFEGYEGGYTNQSGSANDVGGKKRVLDSNSDGNKKSKTSTSGMDVSTLNEMVKYNQQQFSTITDSDLPIEEKQEKLKKVIERQSMLLEMQSEMIKNEKFSDDPMEGKDSGSTRGSHMARGPPMGRGQPKRMGHPMGMGPPIGMGPPMGRGPPMGFEPPMGMGYPMGRGMGGPSMMDGRMHRGAGMMGLGARDFRKGFNFNQHFMNYDDAPPPQSQNISIEEKFMYFKDLLLDQFDPSLTCFQMIEKGRRSIDDVMMKVRTDYRFDRHDDEEGAEIHGKLKILGVTVAKACGSHEKMVREEVFRRALYILHTKTVSEILQISNEENESERPLKFVYSYSKQQLMKLYRKMPKTDNPRDIIRDLNFNCSMTGIQITCVLYRGDTEENKVRCDVYADDCFLGTGDGEERKEAIRKAYLNGYERLRTKTLDELVSDNRKLILLNRHDSRILDILVKGRFYEVGSNIGGLIAKSAAKDQDSDGLNEVVVMIQTGKQEPVPYKVLETTATANKLLLEYVLHSSDKVRDCKDFRCLMYINGKLISCSIGQNKPQAKFSAAECAVRELTCRYSLIEYITRRYVATTSNEDLIEMAMTLKRSGRDIKDEIPAEFLNNPTGDELDPFIYRILENMILDYSSLETLEELIFGPDLPELVIDQLVKKCKEWNVDGNKRTSGGHTYLVMNKIKQFSASQMCDFLLSQPSFSCGRYCLIHMRQPKGRLQFLNECSSDIKRYLISDDADNRDIPDDLGLFD